MAIVAAPPCLADQVVVGPVAKGNVDACTVCVCEALCLGIPWTGKISKVPRDWDFSIPI